MTITEFLTARYDEEEAVARAVIDAPPAYGLAQGHDAFDESVNIASNEGGLVEAVSHMRRWSPEHVLADVAAKRAIVRHARQAQEAVEARLTEPPGPVSGHVIAYRDVVRLLAQPYAEHPDFDPAWRTNGG